MILVFGSINMDLVASVAAIPRPGETVLSPGYRTLFGGKGANQAVAAARMGGEVAMVGRVGNDGFGASCRGNLAANGVATEHILTGAEPTGCAFITVDAAGENAITVASGANGAVAAGDLPESLISAGTVAVMQMEVPLAASLDAARRVKAAGGRVVWNLAPAPPGLKAADLQALLAATDVFVVNEIEAMMAADALGGAADFKDAARRLAQAGSTTCVVTAGAAGAFACEPDGTLHHAPALPRHAGRHHRCRRHLRRRAGGRTRLARATGRGAPPRLCRRLPGLPCRGRAGRHAHPPATRRPAFRDGGCQGGAVACIENLSSERTKRKLSCRRQAHRLLTNGPARPSGREEATP